jgi:HlyD family secretion protein
MAQKKRRIGWWIGAVILVLGAGAGWMGFRHGDVTIDPSKLAKVERMDLAKSVVATGRVQPITKVEVKSKASGLIRKLDVDVGDRVHTGQVLAELDREQLQAQVQEMKASLADAEAAVQSAQATFARDKVDAKGVDVPFLRRDMVRAQKMYKEGLISSQALDDAEKNFRIAENKMNVAHSALAVDQAQIAEAKAKVLQARASLDNAQADLSYATIRSPINGVVLSRDVEIGDAVSSILVLGSQATLVMTLGDMHQVYIKGKVDESDIGQVHVGQNARIKVQSYPNHSFTGVVTKIYPMGVEKDNVTTFEVRVSVENPGGLLKADMSANAEIVQEEHKKVLTIPEGAVIYDSKRATFVQVPDPKAPNGMRQIPVKLGISNGARTEVLSGLTEGQQVVLQS